jgi:tetratricopeptide (TPR) repeat protein
MTTRVACRSGGIVALFFLGLLSACVSRNPADFDPRGEDAAMAAFHTNRFADAAAIYEDLLAATPADDAETLARLRSRLADTQYEWALAEALKADEERNTAGYAEAVARCRIAADIDPARKRKFDAGVDRYTRRMNTLAYEQAVAIATIDPDGAQRRREIAVLMAQGDALFDAGRWEGARERYRGVLALDPYNRDAVSRVQRLAGESTRVARIRRRADDAERLAEAEWRYVQPIAPPTDSTATTAPVAPGTLTPPSLEQRLDGIAYRSLDFQQTPLSEVIAELSAGSQIPEAPGGVRFRYDGVDPAAPEWPTVTFRADNISLRDALGAILPAVGLGFACEADAVVVRRASPAP